MSLEEEVPETDFFEEEEEELEEDEDERDRRFGIEFRSFCGAAISSDRSRKK